MFDSDHPQHLATIGFLCQQTQRSYFDVLQTLTDAGVKPAVVINLVPHYEWDRASRVLDRPSMIRGGGNE